jgi:hypothetical protein
VADNVSQTQTAVNLPSGFEGLTRFSDWIIPTEAGRIERRLTVPMPQAQAFYDGMVIELDHIMAYLRSRPATEVSPEDEALLHLTFSLHEVAQAVEIYGQGAVVDGADVRLFTSVLERPAAASGGPRA